MRKKLVQASLFPEQPRPLPPPSSRPRSVLQLDMDDALDGFMLDFRSRFGRDWRDPVSVAHLFLKWCKDHDRSPRETIFRLPKPRTTPEALIKWCIGKADIVSSTDENYHVWFQKHEERRLRLRGGKSMRLGDVLRAAINNPANSHNS